MNKLRSERKANESPSQEANKLKKNQCGECMKCFSSSQSLREHQYLHTRIKSYICNICSKSFRYGSQLCIHKRSHFAQVDIKIPKLTDLISLKKEPEFNPILLLELVRIPPIRKAEETFLPSFF